MAEPPSQKQLGVTKEDIISSLPDSLLLHILSFLPLRTCVMTSFLSSRWRDIWKHLQVIDLDDYFEDFERQAVFVNSAFRLSKSFKYLLKLRLRSDFPEMRDSLLKWLGAVRGPHLQELYFWHFQGFEDEEDPDTYFSLPPALFACTNLVKLSLAGGIYFNLESISEIRLPSLKTLKIWDMLTDTASVNVFLAGCPVLEDLNIEMLFLESSGGICVPSSLKRLVIETLSHIWAYFQINAPGLEYLKLVHMTLDLDLKMYNLQNVVEAYVDLYPLSPNNYTSTLLEFLHLLTGIKHLVLSLDTTKWLLSASGLNFPEYRHLRHLELNLPCFNSYLVFSLLEKCHVLQVLIIQNDPPRLLRYPQVHSNLPKWVQKTSVSNCLESHLTSLHIKGFQGSEGEIRFAQYILQKGLVLSTVNITSNLEEKLGVLERLSNMPWGSATCRLQFD